MFRIALTAQDFRFVITNSHYAILAGAFLRPVSVDPSRVGVDPPRSFVG